MLTELRNSMCKIRSFFQHSSRTSEQYDGAAEESTEPPRWSISALTRKLQQRCAYIQTSSEEAEKQFPMPMSSNSATKSSLRWVFLATLILMGKMEFDSVESSRPWSAVFSDFFSSVENSESPTTPFGIKAFKTVPSQSLDERCNSGPADQYLVESLSTIENPYVADLITDVNTGLPTIPPKLCSLGTGGVYFLTSGASGDTVAVFKPTDEEPQGINNPKGYKRSEDDVSDSLREGIQTGEGAMRERAAFLLDHQSISGIPPTALVTLTSKSDPDFEKIGSLQQYVPFDYDAEECGTGLFSVEEVQKICLADMRFVNTDRNGQNILVSKHKDGRTTLTPIDHGYCFPDSFADIYFEWMHWPQAKQPFNATLSKFIEDLDPEADLDMLRDHDILFRSECNQIFLFVNYLLKWAVRRRCTPRDIALILSDTKSTVLRDTFDVSIELSHGMMTESQVYSVLDRNAEALMSCVQQRFA